MQTFDGSTRDGIRLTMRSTVLGIDLLRAQTRRRTETVAVFGNCGEYIGIPL
jgi:hypothetical protein